jgi:hypothetical protein
MKLTVSFGKNYKRHLGDGLTFEYTYYRKKWISQVDMTLWNEDSHVSLCSVNKRYVNWERFGLPRKLAYNIALRNLNKQAQLVAGVDLIPSISNN